jgi:hypothetical protein
MGERTFVDDLFLVGGFFDLFLSVSPRVVSAWRIDDFANPVFSSISRKEHPAS